MTDRFLNLGALITVAAVVLWVQAPVAGQTPRTPWGDPDLQGVYTFATTTPMERPEALADQESYSEAELTELEARAAAANLIPDRPAEGARVPGGYDRIWTAGERGLPSNRTSLVVDPPNGRIPPLIPEGQRVLTEREAEIESRQVSRIGGDGQPTQDTVYNIWTDLSAYHRCQARAIPRTWQAYNNGVQILQTPGYVVLHYESMHDARIIPLDSRAALDGNIRQWNGSSRGHWEGDTLVVQMTNFTDALTTFPLRAGPTESLFPMGDMEIVERFTKIDENTIEYEVTVNDPTTWIQPWTFVIPWRSDDEMYQRPEHLYEFACHEGNYRMMEDALKGSLRLLEQAPD